MNLNLYYFDSCPFCQIVLSEIRKLNINCKLTDIHNDLSERDFLYNETGRFTVPCLFIDNNHMHESRDIIKWLRENKEKLRKEK
jgi:glutaredoxin 3